MAFQPKGRKAAENTPAAVTSPELVAHVEGEAHDAAAPAVSDCRRLLSIKARIEVAIRKAPGGEAGRDLAELLEACTRIEAARRQDVADIASTGDPHVRASKERDKAIAAVKAARDLEEAGTMDPAVAIENHHAVIVALAHLAVAEREFRRTRDAINNPPCAAADQAARFLRAFDTAERETRELLDRLMRLHQDHSATAIDQGNDQREGDRVRTGDGAHKRPGQPRDPRILGMWRLVELEELDRAKKESGIMRQGVPFDFVAPLRDLFEKRRAVASQGAYQAITQAREALARLSDQERSLLVAEARRTDRRNEPAPRGGLVPQ